jgi:hypothetical protein
MRIRRSLFCSALLLLPMLALAADPPPSEDALPPPPADEPIGDIPPGPSEASAPTVEIRRIANGDVIEEYRTNGRLTEIRVKPLNGPSYTVLDANGDGKLDRKDSEGPVAPVYYTIYEWD